jgi:hypothetical protein
MTDEDLQRLDDLLSDATSAYWVDDSPLPAIEAARDLVERELATREAARLTPSEPG